MHEDFFPYIITSHLFIILIILLLLSAFFSGSETSMMSLNRYRLKHLAKSNKKAKYANDLLTRPDRLLGVILIGNNFVNIAASAIATLIGFKLFGDIGIIITTIILTIVILIFSEILPKTLGALHPESIALPASIPLKFFLKLLFPLVWLANCIANSILKLFGIKMQKKAEIISLEELRTVISEARGVIPNRHQEMLANILDLEKIVVEDIMIPRTEIDGIDLDDELNSITNHLVNTQHTLLPVFHGDLESVVGIIHIRNITRYLNSANFSVENITSQMYKPYFIPEGTSLHYQLIDFQRHKTRMGLVIDEYGDIAGLITLEDILEEIVGKFTTDVDNISRSIHPQADGSFIIDGSVTIRVLNRTIGWELPADKAKTLSGVIIAHLEAIPKPATCVLLNGYPIEIVQVQDNIIKSVRVFSKIH